MKPATAAELAEMERLQDELAAKVIRRLFEPAGDWRDFAIPVPRIEAALEAIRPGAKSRLRRALALLVRAKFIRRRISCGQTLYEAVLTKEEIES